MYFVCNHHDGDRRKLYVGSNQANWKPLYAIWGIRRADRDRRLETYIPLARNAFYALKRAEEKAENEITLQNFMVELEPDHRRYLARCRAIVEMKKGPHPDFLGRTKEIGQAFSRTMKPHQCCYFCKGMMGYRVPHPFKREDIENYLCHVQSRGDYTHSCAEVEVSLQCSRNWMEHNRDWNY
jgi:hypothetical protein